MADELMKAWRRYRDALAEIRERERARIEEVFDRYDRGELGRGEVLKEIDVFAGEAFTAGLLAWDECGRPLGKGAAVGQDPGAITSGRRR